MVLGRAGSGDAAAASGRFSLGAVYYGSTLTIARTFDKNDDDDDVRCRFRYDVIFSIFTASLVGKAIAIQLIDVVGRVRMICAACLAYVAFFLPIAVGVDSFTGRYISLYGVLAGAVVAGSCAWVQIPELHVRRANISLMNRGAAAAATWKFLGDRRARPGTTPK